MFTHMYSSTCFRSPHIHHQELNNCISSLWFYCWSVVVAVLLVVVGPVASGWLIHLKHMMMHGLANFKFTEINVLIRHSLHTVSGNISFGRVCRLTLILLTWRIWWAPINASRWQMGFNSTFKGLMPPNRYRFRSQNIRLNELLELVYHCKP
jgi:hypothetical protein